MKRILWISALAYAMLGYVSPAYSQCQKQRNIVILYENDVHCAMDGYAKLAGLRDAIADEYDAPPVVGRCLYFAVILFVSAEVCPVVLRIADK